MDHILLHLICMEQSRVESKLYTLDLVWLTLFYILTSRVSALAMIDRIKIYKNVVQAPYISAHEEIQTLLEPVPVYAHFFTALLLT